MSRFYLLKITLKNIPCPVWRRFVVPANIKLDDLHRIIQTVMGWENSHLHSFKVGKQEYVPEEVLEYDDYGALPEDEYTLDSVAPRKGSKIRYQYDFGDSWDHEIVVEDSNYVDPDQSHPYYCVNGAGACPPEDCGGAWGYADFCESLTDPEHPDHEERKEWYGGEFDPKHFDTDEVNKGLGVKKKSPPTKKSTKKTQVAG